MQHAECGAIWFSRKEPSRTCCWVESIAQLALSGELSKEGSLSRKLRWTSMPDHPSSSRKGTSRFRPIKYLHLALVSDMSDGLSKRDPARCITQSSQVTQASGCHSCRLYRFVRYKGGCQQGGASR